MTYTIPNYKVKSFTFECFYFTPLIKYVEYLEGFSDNLKDYEMLFTYNDFINLESDHYLHTKPEVLECLFCKKNETQVTFNTRPHVIPEFLGNKHLLHYPECDSCNQKFGRTLEDSFNKYTSFFRTMQRIKNKKGKVIQYQNIKNTFNISFNKHTNSFEVNGEELDCNFIDDQNGGLQIKVEIQKHIKSNIYKLFMKIFYSLLPIEHRDNFKEIPDWINSNDPSDYLVEPASVLLSTIQGMGLDRPYIVIAAKKNILNTDHDLLMDNNEYEYMGILTCGNLIFEMPLTSDLTIKKYNKLKQEGKPVNFKFQRIPSYSIPISHTILDFSNSVAEVDQMIVQAKYTIKDKRT
ncbi:HNH endonuclease [Acinetobacter higginsii]|uniref:HNH endonuclease n=1 Tax=Acinetobacter higginsii TaxID=70347 RepID=UPI0026755CEF|nr:HNH endonuclease [Acinetobacter higginsii]MDO3665041.1 HNH endonuclease [Acinetobacter higginsii]